MGKKGQIEVIALFGIIFLVVVVVFYAYQGGTFGASPVPVGVAEQQNSVKSTINNFIRLGAQEVLANISIYGGYSNEAEFFSSTEFNGRPVPYWFNDGSLNLPTNIHTNFMNGLTVYIRENIGDLIEEIQMENVTVDLSILSVSGNILTDSVVLNVYLPVYVQNYLIVQPFTVTVYSRFGETVDLANNMINFMSASRPFEWFTLSSMIISPLENNQPTIPVFVTLLECGQIYNKNWHQVQPDLEKAIKKTLANTYMPGKVPLGTMSVSSTPKYSMPRFYGKDYADLDVSFHVPDDFELGPGTFQMNPSTVSVYAKSIYLTSICQSDPVYVNYYVKYPVVVRIRDPETGNVFQFVSDVMIYNNEPGNWGVSLEGFDPTEQAELCSDNVCEFQGVVKDGNGNPVKDATLIYMGCSVGETNSNGFVYSTIPCGSGPLEVYKEGYKFWRRNLPWNAFVDENHDVNDYDITIKKTINAYVNIYEVNFEEHATNYILNNVEPLDDRTFKLILKPYGETYCEGTNIVCERFYTEASGELLNIVVGSHAITGMLANDFQTEAYGGFAGSFGMTEDMDGTTLYIYVPKNTHEFPALEGGKVTEYMVAYMRAFDKCGITPISTTKTSAPSRPLGA